MEFFIEQTTGSLNWMPEKLEHTGAENVEDGVSEAEDCI
jgi:hypothetical protein